MSGNAYVEDEQIADRKEIIDTLEANQQEQNAAEVLEDMILKVKTPELPKPDLSIPLVRKQEFESLNPDYYYTENVYELFKNLESQIYKELELEPDTQEWNMELSYLQKLI